MGERRPFSLPPNRNGEGSAGCPAGPLPFLPNLPSNETRFNAPQVAQRTGGVAETDRKWVGSRPFAWEFCKGLRNFLPISSSGHLALAQYFLGLEETPLFFDAMLHVGTGSAVIAFFLRRRFTRQAAAGDEVESASQSSSGAIAPVRLIGFLILATVPAAGAALFFRPTKLEEGQTLESVSRTWRNRIGDLREYSSHRPWTVLGFMASTGAILVVGSRASGGRIESRSTRVWHVLVIGAAQACSAVCPGMSRSGLTVSTGLLLGLRGEWAVHFSLLMSIPAVFGAAVLKAKDLDPSWITLSNLSATALGTAVSAIVGWYCIRVLVRVVRGGRWWWFSAYLWVFVAVVGLGLIL